jgi:Carbohydrate binding module (family 6)
MFKRNRRSRESSFPTAQILLGAALILGAPCNTWSQCVTEAPCPFSTCVTDDHSIDAVIGWDGDQDAVYTHMDGSFRVRNDKCTTVGFSIYNNPSTLQWYNESGYLPCLTTTFERDNCTVSISNFGDKVTIPGNLGYNYVVIYSRVSVYNHDSVAHTLCPGQYGALVALTSNSCTVSPGQTVHHDFAIAVDKFNNTYPWPTDANLVNAGSWDTHYARMANYWNSKLGGIVNITALPDKTLINAYKAGYIYTHIVKDACCLKVAEGPLYDKVFNHDEIGILSDLLVLGDFTEAQTFLPNLGGGIDQDDARYKYPWPWAIYLQKTGDIGLVSSNFSNISAAAHSIDTDRTGPGGIIKPTYTLDNLGFWTVDNWSALMGLSAYKYICNRLGNIAEQTWAINEYNSLLTSVNNVLSSTMTSSNINYIPIAMLESNALRDPRDAGWASMFLFGRWAWDGYLFGASQTGVSFSNIDNTYDAGFLKGHAAGLAYHNFGFFPGFSPSGYSTVYNTGSASAALMGEKYRSEGIYAYEFMISNGQSGPFCWHEDYNAPGPSPWVGNHPSSGYPDSPHMWGQSLATKVFIDSLIAERTDGSVIIGRGVPNAWVTNGQVIALSNFPIATNNRMGFTLQGIASNEIMLTLTGANPLGGTVLDLRAFKNNIQSVTVGTPDNNAGTVTLAPGVTTTTVTLITPNPTPIPTPTPLPTPAYTPPVGGTFIEAESGTLHGCYAQADPNASGSARVDGIDANNDYVGFSSFPGTNVIKIRYASPNTGTFGLYVDNIRVASIPITSTGSWTTFGEKTVNVSIRTGAPVRFEYDNNATIHDVAINLDCIVVGVIEMESGTRTGGATPVPDSYASAGLRIDNLFNSSDSVTFSPFPAASQLALRYSSVSSGSTALSLYINNVLSQTITLPETAIKGGGGPYAYADQVVDVNISAGATVKFQGSTGQALYDCINLAPKMEAENATLHGCYIQSDPNASGGARVDGIDAPGDYVSFSNVQGGSRLTFRYATALSYGLLSLYINNQFRCYVYFPSTGSWVSFRDKVIATNISPGATVKLQFDSSDAAINLDYIRNN